MENKNKKEHCQKLMDLVEELNDKEKINEDDYQKMMFELGKIVKDGEINDPKYIKVIKIEPDTQIFCDDDCDSYISTVGCHGWSHNSCHNDDPHLVQCEVTAKLKQHICLLRVEPSRPDRSCIGDDYMEIRPYKELKEKKWISPNNYTIYVLLDDDPVPTFVA